MPSGFPRTGYAGVPLSYAPVPSGSLGERRSAKYCVEVGAGARRRGLGDAGGGMGRAVRKRACVFNESPAPPFGGERLLPARSVRYTKGRSPYGRAPGPSGRCTNIFMREWTDR